jgi:hypothetical protein
LSIAAPSLDVALALSIPILIPLLIFAGYFLNNASTPDFLLWIKYISWFFYANDAVLIQFWPSIKSIPCSIQNTNVSSTCSATRCYKNGDEVLESLNIKKVRFF